MEHFINDFGHVDSTLDFHFCPHRIFKISKDLKYPEVEHVFLKSEERKLMVHQSNIIATTILYYHYAYVKGKEDIIEKYEKHMSKSNIHTTKFLDWWKHSHLFGSFPVKDFIGKHPKPVIEKFKL